MPFLKFHFLTLFPEMFQSVLQSSLLGKASARGDLQFSCVSIRDFSTDKHRTADDTPYGGGVGMLLKVDVLYAAWQSIVSQTDEPPPVSDANVLQSKKRVTVLLSPQGELFNQEIASELADHDEIIFVCGHYEGVDERFIDLCVDREISIGDYVLTGGELPAMVMADAIARHIPGVVGKVDSVETDSLSDGLLKYPQYTRPQVFREREVPAVLLSGNHQQIIAWRKQQQEERTQRKRPDLWSRLKKK